MDIRAISANLSAKDWLTEVSSLLIGVLIASLSAYVTVRLAFRRFYSEKRWEQKAHAYTKVFVALHQLKEHSVHELKLVEGPDFLPPGSDAEKKRREVMDRLEDEMSKGISELRLQIDIGSFVLDQAAVRLLEKLMLGLDESIEVWRRERNLAKHFDHKLRVIDACQRDLREIAHRDLSQCWKRG
jgi:hypothetical protein